MADEYAEYHELRGQLVKTALIFSRKITAFALLEELIDLQGMFCFSADELVFANDSDLLKKCRLILHKAEEFFKDLEGYDIDQDAVSSFQQMIERLTNVESPAAL
jgi:hypothetical protein